MQITNIDVGPRGVFTKDGGVVIIPPGEIRDVDLHKAEAADLNPEWFKKGGSAPASKES